MVRFQVKDERVGDRTFHTVTRKLYKKMVTVTDEAGAMFRVGTSYVSGTPVKQLTLLKRIM